MLYGDHKAKSVIDAQTIKRKEGKHFSLEDHHSQRKTARGAVGNRGPQESQQTINKIEISTYLSVITFKVSGLNSPIKKHRVAEEIEKHGLSVCFPQETHHRYKDERWYFVQI